MLSKRQFNALLYVVVILFTIACLASVLAALSSEEWLLAKFSGFNMEHVLQNGAYVGPSRMRTEYQAGWTSGSTTLQAALVWKTDDFFSFWQTVMASNYRCDGIGQRFLDAASGIKIATALTIFAVIFQFAAFVVVYQTMMHKWMFKYPHFSSAGFYITATILYVAAASLFYAKMNNLGGSCSAGSLSVDLTVKWGLGMLAMSSILSAVCGGCMIFLKKAPVVKRMERMSDNQALVLDSHPPATTASSEDLSQQDNPFARATAV